VETASSRISPTSLLQLGSAPLEPFDLLGRNKIMALGLTTESPESDVKKAAHSAFAAIERNHFKFKSLSSWSYNIAVGCQHGCRFCYVPDSQQTGPGKKKENTGPLAAALREFGVLDADADWGRYVLFRPWDEQRFLASLASAENTPAEELNADGNRAIILCSTTDPYQTVKIPGNTTKQDLLNGHCRFLVRRALELILKHSTLSVRILSRSPLAKIDFDLYKRFGNRLLFGMSLPTLNDKLREVYEPWAPGVAARLKTLQKAAEEGIPLYVAVAPTYPECDEKDLRATLTAIQPLKPLTIFHEPINIRAENVRRIATHGAELGVQLRTEVFDNGPSWRRYAVEQLMTMQKVAQELGMEQHLHLWPDKALRSKSRFLETRETLFAAKNTGVVETAFEKAQRRERDQAAYDQFAQWLSHWHGRISEWPGKRS
jgi:DNA repair photolyase